MAIGQYGSRKLWPCSQYAVKTRLVIAAIGPMIGMIEIGISEQRDSPDMFEHRGIALVLRNCLIHVPCDLGALAVAD